MPWPPKRLEVPWQLQALVMGATCAHSSMAQYCSRFTVGRVGGLGARLGSESRGKGGSAHWTVRSPKSAPYTRRKQYIRLKPVLARPSCDASGKRLRSQRALLQLLATTFHDSAAGEGFAGSLRRFVSSPPSTTPLVWQCSNVVVAASAAPSGKQRWTMNVAARCVASATLHLEKLSVLLFLSTSLSSHSAVRP